MKFKYLLATLLLTFMANCVVHAQQTTQITFPCNDPGKGLTFDCAGSKTVQTTVVTQAPTSIAVRDKSVAPAVQINNPASVTVVQSDQPREFYSEDSPYYVSRDAGTAYAIEPQVVRERTAVNMHQVDVGVVGLRPAVRYSGTFGTVTTTLESSGGRIVPAVNFNPLLDDLSLGGLGRLGELGGFGYGVPHLRRAPWQTGRF